MTQLSGVAATVKNQRRVAVPGQFALQFLKLAVGYADSRRNMALVIFGFLGTRIYYNGRVSLNLFGHVSGINRSVIALGFHPCRKTL